MTIELTWYSVLRERVGRDQESVEFDGGTAGDLYFRLETLHGFDLPHRNLRVAINDTFADWESALRDGDRVVYIAPCGRRVMDLFSLSASPLDPCGLARTVADRAAGGYVSFEGWVRDHHEGRAVDHLEYEAYPALCQSAGTEIVQEAIERFRLRRARAVHRTGALAIGEIAVWVGVSTDHRHEAFLACEWIIDRIKHDLPIWKKEFYPDGTSVWVRCQACANHPVAA